MLACLPCRSDLACPWSLLLHPISTMSSILDSFDELRPEVSDSELSSTLNTTAFNTASQATAGVSTVATA